MNNKAILIKTDGSKREVKPKDGERFTLEEMQELVAGYIEIVHIGESQILVVNEMGKLYNLDLNDQATALARNHNSISAEDYIVGDAVLMDNELLD